MAVNLRYVSAELRLARRLWGKLSQLTVSSLKGLLKSFSLSVASGDLLYLDGRWYVTHTGLLRLAARNRCSGIRVQPVKEFCDPQAGRWVFKVTVYKSRNCKGFVGYGDADPSNVSSLVRGAEMRVAETRAVNRALRKAYGIGICSVEEIGSFPAPRDRPTKLTKAPAAGESIPGNGNGQPRLRDRLCQLIRQYRLDPDLVKRYAADFCGTGTLRAASRELVQDFINQLADSAAKDLPALVCRLNSYAPAQPEVKP